MTTDTKIDFPALFPELQHIARQYCSPVAQSMLSMTCKAEQLEASEETRTRLLFRLAADASKWTVAHLKRILAYPGFDRFIAHDKWDLHELQHEAIRSGSLDLVHWLTTDSCELFEWKCCDKGECIKLAIQRRDFFILEFVMHTALCERRHDSSEMWLVRNIATVTALQQNDVEMLEFLDLHCYFEAKFDIIVCNRDLPLFGIVDVSGSVRALSWLSHRGAFDSVAHVHNHHIYGMIQKQMTITEIRELLTTSHFSFRDVCETNPWGMLTYGLHYKNQSVAEWAQKQLKDNNDRESLGQTLRIAAKFFKSRPDVLTKLNEWQSQ